MRPMVSEVVQDCFPNVVRSSRMNSIDALRQIAAVVMLLRRHDVSSERLATNLKVVNK